MPEFKFFIDNKETVWRRIYCNVDAENEGEALKKMKGLAIKDDPYEYFTGHEEVLLETFQELSYEENGNNSTVEIYYNDQLVADNTPLHVKREKKINQIINETT